ncbi:OppA family ABC transporter substrate-binding lipoprotein [[Mycoplasma] gypis]|uniref:Lipoprotein n=1 Tax=[Mycoplasma] gypis TaxID=92404 RepID=A0ABZ2RVW7_9BACT|nr:hypothetical protein [[Mycoplasma] gypis]MBN0919591.1 hypothetical protein [[Mycoplasma] gypis]
MNLKKMIFLSAPLVTMFSLPCIAASCNKNDFLPAHDTFVRNFNYANSLEDFSYLKSDSVNKQVRLATASKLFRVESLSEAKIDFINNEVQTPGLVRFKLEYVKSVEITWLNGTKYQTDIFDNDNWDNNQSFSKNELTQFVTSSDNHSINSDNFKIALKNAKKIKINVNENKSQWVDFKQKNTGFAVSLKDFKFGILKNLLKDKEFFEKHKNALGIKKNINANFNNNNVFTLLSSNNISTASFDNLEFINQDYLEFDITNSSQNLQNWFVNFFIIGEYSDAIPSFLFNSNSLEQNFFDYYKQTQNMLFSSYYIITKNNIDELEMKENNLYTNKDDVFKTVIFKFKLLPLQSDTFQIQDYNAFKQNTNSLLVFENLNALQKQEILNKWDKYKISYFKNLKMYKNQSSFIQNFLINSNNTEFNDEFMWLNFGLKNNEQSDVKISNILNEKVFIFRSYINNLVNQAVYSNLNNQKLYFSQIPVNALIDSNNVDSSNYKSIYDGYQLINKQIILDKHGFKINNSTSYNNEEKTENLNNIINIQKSLYSYDFENIKSHLTRFLDENMLNKKNNIVWTIPLDLRNNKNIELIKLLSQKIKNVFSEADTRLNPKFIFIENNSDYNFWISNNKSIYKENNFNLQLPNTTNFLQTFLTVNNFESIFILNSASKINAFLEIQKFINFLKNDFNTQNINLENVLNEIKKNDLKNIEQYFNKFNFNKNIFKNILNKSIQNFANSHNTFEILNLINEINNIFSYTMSFDNFVSLNSYQKEIIQKFIFKPAQFLDLDYIQDLKIIK